VCRRPRRVDEDRELVAAEPRDLVAVAQRGSQPGADLSQQGIPGRVPECVVDLLEAVEVEQEHGDPGVPGGDRLAKRSEEAAPVEQARELVVVGLEAALARLRAQRPSLELRDEHPALSQGEEADRDQHPERRRDDDQPGRENRVPLCARAPFR
jgi:hypothetical protein